MLNAEVVLDYLRFFVFFLRGSDGPFTLLETELELLPSDGETVTPELEELRARIRPMRIGGQDSQGRFLVPATVAYDGTMWRTTLAVSAGGEVEMIDEKDPVALGTARVPQCPYLDAPAAETEAPSAEIAPTEVPAEEDAMDEATPVPPARPQALEETVSDREITRAVVSVLLAGAVRERVGNTLLKRFNSQTQADDPIAQLARFVSGSHPIIIIESDIPFVEDIVAVCSSPSSAARASPPWIGPRRSRATTPAAFSISPGSPSENYFLISFHAYRSLWDAEWVAHELAIHGSTVLIGCTRQSEVPEALRRVADLVLTLPRIDRRLFARIFAKVFGTPPPANWDRGGPDWTHYLIAADFHAPRRLKLTASQAVQYLRQRVRARLRQVSAVDAPALASLHGLGEARQVAEDLIADIRAAQTGVLPWAAIDRGLLLVGPPGVGKTTLARSIARDCGVRFVVASAANWQAAGGLDVHLRAMRADFNEGTPLCTLDPVHRRNRQCRQPRADLRAERAVPDRGHQRAARAAAGLPRTRACRRHCRHEQCRDGGPGAASRRTARPDDRHTPAQRRQPAAHVQRSPGRTSEEGNVAERRPGASSRRACFRSHRCRCRFLRAWRRAARAQPRATDRPGGSRRRGDAPAAWLLRHPSQAAR
jgi:hypothetical protein